MTNLRTYTEQAMTEAYTKAGAFYAFGQSQFDEQKKPDTVYVDMGYGLVCPKDTADQLKQDINNVTAQGIQKDIEVNTIPNIIKRELYNTEAFYSGDITDTYNYLKAYNITPEQIQAVYNEERQHAEV